MKVTAEHVRILHAAFRGELYHTQHGRWRIANATPPSFRCRRQLVQAGYLSPRNVITDRGLALLRSKREGLLT